MFKNYFTVAIRNLMRHKMHSVINVLGLAVGMACCLIIVLFLRHELSYDRYHENADQLYRLTRNGWATTPASLAPAVFDDQTKVEYVRLYPARNQTLLQAGEVFQEDVFFMDKNVFDVFTFPFVKGSALTAFEIPYAFVITEGAAKKYFGGDNPIGKRFVYGKKDYTVTGIIKDIPEHAHLQFDFLTSFERLGDWEGNAKWLQSRRANDFYTYLLFSDRYTSAQFAQQAPEFAKQYYGTDSKVQFFAQPITDIHLHSQLEKEIEPNGNITHVYIFATVALFVLLVACVNFVNLTTVSLVKRTREVGMRKVVGASRLQIVGQFLGEAVLLSVMAVIFAVALVEMGLPYVSHFLGQQLVLDFVRDSEICLVLFVLVLVSGVLAGSYPAFCVSSFRPVYVLKGDTALQGRTGGFRSGLLVFQFVVASVLMIGAGIVYQQIAFVQNRDVGFDKTKVLVIPKKLPFEVYRTVKQEFLRLSGVTHVSTASSLPGIRMPVGGIQFGVQNRSEAYQKNQSVRLVRVGHDFVQALGLSVVDGEDFKIDKKSTGSILMNEAALMRFGGEDVIGQRVKVMGRGESTVVGVVKDFNYMSMREKVEPLVLWLRPQTGEKYIVVRVHTEDISGMLSHLKTQWRKIASDQPFDYFFLDEQYDALHRADIQMQHLLTGFSSLIIFVSCLGLLGLVSFAVVRRTKEIGIRKVLGASVWRVVLVLSSGLVMPVFGAVLVAWPISYVLMNWWLQDFAYRIDLGIMPFMLGGALTIGIALVTVGIQAWKAASMNPVDAIKCE